MGAGRPSRRAFRLAAVAPFLPALPAAGADRTAVTVERALSCTLDVAEYNAFAFRVHDEPAARRALGMTAVRGPNPLLAEYRLARPVAAFGRPTRRVAFTSSGLLALLEGVDAAALARELDVPAVVDRPEKFLGQRVLVDEPVDLGAPGVEARRRITRDVSTVSTHPGVVFAGCGYRIDVE